jgi:deazaflavin-dependent oxidoreductase (nitroreductase family)
MPLRRWIARFNRRVTNVLTLRLAGRAPGFGIVTHRGRRSGKLYRTPVNVFPSRDGYVIALTYGLDSDWVKNVLAAGECDLQTRGRSVHLTTPHVFHDERRGTMPGPVRVILGRLGVADFMALHLPHHDPLHDSCALRPEGNLGDKRSSGEV